jgi:hypothetical protein
VLGFVSTGILSLAWGEETFLNERSCDFGFFHRVLSELLFRQLLLQLIIALNLTQALLLLHDIALPITHLLLFLLLFFLYTLECEYILRHKATW